jgi:hypothetical protein
MSYRTGPPHRTYCWSRPPPRQHPSPTAAAAPSPTVAAPLSCSPRLPTAARRRSRWRTGDGRSVLRRASDLDARTHGPRRTQGRDPSHEDHRGRGQSGMDRWRRFQNRIEFGYEQHCLGTPNSGRSYARRAHASRSCPRSWMSPSIGSILGEQGQQPTDQCRLYARQHRAGA